MLHVMVDIETMDNSPTSAIISIGAVVFGSKGVLHAKPFYVDVDLNSSMESGGTIGADTVRWWLLESDEARRAIATKGRTPLPQALAAFTAWLDSFPAKDEDRCIWGNGASFDNVIVASAYRRLGMEPPWKFWNDRCFRTLKASYDIRYEKPKQAHHALSDAIAQAEHMVKICSAGYTLK